MKKMNRRITLLAVFLCTMVAGVYAQSDDFGIWTSAEVKKKIFPGFDASVEGEFRTRDGVDNVERWSAGAGVAYRITSFLKADGGYTFIYSHSPGEMTKKGNYVSDYWSPRHRMYLSLTGKLNWQRFEFSLRERYQYTYRTSQLVSKYDGDDGSQKADEEITGKGKNVLRSRLQAEWNIKKSRFAPYASCELYHSMSDSWALDKTRWTLGTGYKINKKNSLDFFYRYQNHADDDETNGHVVGAGYTFKF